MSWLGDYHDREDWGEYHVEYLPIGADLDSWEKYVEEGLYSLAQAESFPYDLASADLDLSMSQEDADIGEEALDG